ncbi:swr complex subunit [Recurvomyces mirabilis]|uniref:SWR1-complex protein 4 n=1 Tax=Recurvomyces mirabilis TaxID=574656 RepID=A0AAE0TP51_9PEZI|nr:swr complex subunit [Recurvomyces mirabilis]KAK5156593.1 swr complex subunit [Recurvomyces mirabilis]
MATGADIRAALGSDFATNALPSLPRTASTQVSQAATKNSSQPRRHKRSLLRRGGKAVHWSRDSTGVSSRRDQLRLIRWRRARDDEEPFARFAKYDVHAELPQYDAEIYEAHLTHPEWTKDETDGLMEAYGDNYGKWPVITDRYDTGRPRSMEDLKARFYGVSATVLSLNTPISSMTGPQYTLYDTLRNFDPAKEASRKKLAEGHLQRRQTEVDEETVLLGELQRIMLNQANLDSEREDLRRRLDHPLANTNGYQYNTSQALTQLWQQLLQTDRMKKNQRLRATGNQTFDGLPGTTPTSARPRDSIAGISDSGAASGRRPTRDSLPSATTPGSTLPVDMSKADLARFGVVVAQDKISSGITFASDRLSKPRIAKSTLQTDKIAAILTHAGVPDLIALPTPAVIEQFDAIMSKVHALLDMRKLAEKEEQELRVRSAEAA